MYDYLLSKMEKYDIRENVLEWFKSYQSDHKQRISSSMVVK